MPSMKQTIAGIGLSAVILTGGAYLAFQLPGISEYVISYDRGNVSTESVSSNTAKETSIPVSPQQQVSANSLNLTISDIKRPYGKVIVMIYGDEESFYNYDLDGLIGYQELPVTSSSVSAKFDQLGEGPFVVSFFQDEDGNGDLTMQGEYPLEGYGGSGMDTPYDEPSFESASLGLGMHVFKMHYLE